MTHLLLRCLGAELPTPKTCQEVFHDPSRPMRLAAVCIQVQDPSVSLRGVVAQCKVPADADRRVGGSSTDRNRVGRCAESEDRPLPPLLLQWRKVAKTCFGMCFDGVSPCEMNSDRTEPFAVPAPHWVRPEGRASRQDSESVRQTTSN